MNIFTAVPGCLTARLADNQLYVDLSAFNFCVSNDARRAYDGGYLCYFAYTVGYIYRHFTYRWRLALWFMYGWKVHGILFYDYVYFTVLSRAIKSTISFLTVVTSPESILSDDRHNPIVLLPASTPSSSVCVYVVV